MTNILSAIEFRRNFENPWPMVYSRLLEVNTVALTILPSGSILGVNVKFLLFLLLLPIASRLIFVSSRTWSKMLPVLLVPWGIVLWSCIANAHGIPLTLIMNQAKDVIAAITGAWFIAIYCSLFSGNSIRIIKIVIITEIGLSLFKLGLFTFATVTGQDVTILLDQISALFKVTLSVSNYGSDTLERFELASDGLLPLCIFAMFALRDKLGFTVNRSAGINMLFLAASFLTFSRYIWGFTLLVLILAYTLLKRENLHKIFFFILFGIAVVTSGYTSNVISDRYSDKFAGSSDKARTDQAVALRTFFLERPLLGHGLGSYSTFLLRSEDNPYSYENQLGALAGQIGIVGCLSMIVLLVSYYFRAFIYTRRPKTYRLALAIIVLFWTSGGFVNPQVVTSQGSLTYGVIFAILFTDPIARPLSIRSETAHMI